MAGTSKSAHGRAAVRPAGAQAYLVWGCSTLEVPVTQVQSPVLRAHGAPTANGDPNEGRAQYGRI